MSDARKKKNEPVRLDQVDLSLELEDKDKADKEIAKLQERLYSLQVRTFLAGRSAIFVFEGWDASGKGGAIKRLTAMMDPRGYKVWPIAAPREHERAHNYLWRFSTRAPEKGEIAIFDRSWYGRVLVERVEGFATKPEWKRAYEEINAFEQTFTADGVAVAKFWIHIDRKMQLKRFKDREENAVKRYKIGPDDWRNRKAWSKYAKAVQEMFDRTHRPDAPWHVIPGNDKRYARREVLRLCADTLERLLESE
jgi:polyphosphate kinase 2 (PPK2 family)